ncbi:MAG: agmatinase [Asgard group archaeon]|nr:agmatinase [Asgard group archaeon]
MNTSTNPIRPFFGTTTDNINFANVCALGIPWDRSSSFRAGAVQGPEYIRHATTEALYNSFTEKGRNLKEVFQVFDIGDAPISDLSEMDAKAKIANMISKHNKYGMKFFFLGGDHLSTYFTFTALKRLNKSRMGLIYLDAHPDLYDHYEGNPYSHACVVKRILDETNIEPETIIQVGIRASTKEQTELASSMKINTITTTDFQQNSAKNIAEQVVNLIPKNLDGVYLSIDLDILDPAFAPGVGNPEPAGLSTREIVEFLQGLQGIKLHAFDIVELCPKFDYSGITALAAAKFVKETLGIM